MEYGFIETSEHPRQIILQDLSEEEFNILRDLILAINNEEPVEIIYNTRTVRL